jgi:predicted tellurium resistance membrane protein TerC
LVIIGGLLSVNNASAIAATAFRLSERRKYPALRLGIIGAYLFRGFCPAVAAYIIANQWLKIIGAACLLNLPCPLFADHEGEDKAGGKVDSAPLVAMSPRVWVACACVVIAMRARRFPAAFVEKYAGAFA